MGRVYFLIIIPFLFSMGCKTPKDINEQTTPSQVAPLDIKTVGDIQPGEFGAQSFVLKGKINSPDKIETGTIYVEGTSGEIFTGEIDTVNSSYNLEVPKYEVNFFSDSAIISVKGEVSSDLNTYSINNQFFVNIKDTVVEIDIDPKNGYYQYYFKMYTKKKGTLTDPVYFSRLAKIWFTNSLGLEFHKDTSWRDRCGPTRCNNNFDPFDMFYDRTIDIWDAHYSYKAVNFKDGLGELTVNIEAHEMLDEGYEIIYPIERGKIILLEQNCQTGCYITIKNLPPIGSEYDTGDLARTTIQGTYSYPDMFKNGFQPDIYVQTGNGTRILAKTDESSFSIKVPGFLGSNLSLFAGGSGSMENGTKISFPSIKVADIGAPLVGDIFIGKNISLGGLA